MGEVERFFYFIATLIAVFFIISATDFLVHSHDIPDGCVLVCDISLLKN